MIEKTSLLALSSRKQGGKDSCFNWYHEQNSKSFRYYFATTVKDMAVDLLGVPFEQVWGSDDQKNELTHLRWENFPVPAYRLTDGSIYIARNGVIEALDANHKILKQKNHLEIYDVACFPHRASGFMSGREVLSYFGTEVVRCFYSEAFVNKTMKHIKEQMEKYPDHKHIICDLRFVNEFDAVKKMGGKVLRFARDLYGSTHESETALDSDKFNHNQFDGIVYNMSMTLEEKNESTEHFFKKWGMLPS